ncbi:hypothetical protein F5X97DRAFT_50557 [Nemania serpens]|nr:hypothetical protein F5X97DRAFT_50557 [Nemania serpens]
MPRVMMPCDANAFCRNMLLLLSCTLFLFFDHAAPCCALLCCAMLCQISTTHFVPSTYSNCLASSAHFISCYTSVSPPPSPPFPIPAANGTMSRILPLIVLSGRHPTERDLSLIRVLSYSSGPGLCDTPSVL